MGNGIVTVKAYNPESGQLRSIVSGLLLDDEGIDSLIGSTQNLSYEFDTLGNLYSRESKRTNSDGEELESLREVFSYDLLNRLKTSEYTSGGLVQSNESYDYDALGNLRRKSDIGDLIYDQTNNASVHGVTMAGGNSYHYDAYGNLSKRIRPNKGTENLAYDTFNKPTQIGETQFYYGPEHARYKQSNSSATTYYFAGGTYEVEVKGGTTTEKSYVGGYLVQTKVGTDISNTYLHKDHLGSVDAMTDDEGNYLGRNSFNVWGQRRKESWVAGTPANDDPVTSRGFTGHEMLDELDLVHMNGRVYDPVIGRFLTPDILIQAPYNTQSYNRYSYVFNNPLSYTDPSGYCGVADMWLGNSEPERANGAQWNMRFSMAGGVTYVGEAADNVSSGVSARKIAASARAKAGVGVGQDDPIIIRTENGRMTAHAGDTGTGAGVSLSDNAQKGGNPVHDPKSGPYEVEVPDDVKTALSITLGVDQSDVSNVKVIANSRWANFLNWGNKLFGGPGIAATTLGKNRILLPSHTSPDFFFNTPSLILHEYFHVFTQWNTGQMNVVNYLMNPNKWEGPAYGYGDSARNQSTYNHVRYFSQ